MLVDHSLKKKKILKNVLDKACFQHNTVYGGFKDLIRRITADKAFIIAKNPKYGCQHGLAAVVYRFFEQKASGGTVEKLNYFNEIISNYYKN